MGKAQQRKGRTGEIELSNILNQHGFHTRPGEAVSFGREADIVGLENIHAEIKRREAVDLSAALRQAAEDAARFGDGLLVVFARGNRQRWRAVMDLDTWVQLYKLALNSENQRFKADDGRGMNNDTTKNQSH